MVFFSADLLSFTSSVLFIYFSSVAAAAICEGNFVIFSYAFVNFDFTIVKFCETVVVAGFISVV